MWLLVMLVFFNGSVTTNYVYYEDMVSCKRAALQFEAEAGKDFRLEAFCIKGE